MLALLLICADQPISSTVFSCAASVILGQGCRIRMRWIVEIIQQRDVKFWTWISFWLLFSKGGFGVCFGLQRSLIRTHSQGEAKRIIIGVIRTILFLLALTYPSWLEKTQVYVEYHPKTGQVYYTYNLLHVLHTLIQVYIIISNYCKHIRRVQCLKILM